ncbi:hypothetical protein IJ095_01050 [Candidatus Saccharibacteria bacterium]|nr:hypothetical protein [Candidatus Saccharibacteria bacterium]
MEETPDEAVVKINHSSSASHTGVQKSSTLNRRYVKKPEAVVTTAESAALDSVAKRRAEDLKRRQALADKINRERLAAMKGRSVTPAAAPAAPAQTVVMPIPTPKPLSATIEKSLAAPATDKPKEIKDSALASAMKDVDSVDADSSAITSSSISTRNTFGAKKLALAFACAALAVGVIGYFVSQNTPDLSVRVAAMQSGIEASYPSYVPRGYSLSDIVSEEGKLEMTFSSSDGTSFVLTEEKSTWDNDALESNYVKPTWNTNYTSIREQGITIYIAGSDAAWVNGGIAYRIDASGNNLTKKQIKSIVVSL